MAFEMELNGNDKVTLKISIEKEQVSKTFDTFVQQVRGRVHIPGFRQNKVPRQVLINHLGQKKVSEEVRKQLVEDSLKEACEKEGLIPITNPDLVFENDPEDGKKFCYHAKMDIVPLLNDISVDGFKIEIGKYQPDEQDLEKVLTKLQDEKSTLEEKVPGESVEEGDLVTVNLEVLDGEEKVTRLSQNEVSLKVENNPGKPQKESQEVPGRLTILKELKGKKEGEEFSFDEKISIDFSDETLQGKKLNYKVKILKIKIQKTPELDDNFATNLDGKKYQTLADLKSDITQQLQTQHSERAKEKACKELIRLISEKNQVQVHPQLIEREADYRIAMIHRQLNSQGADLERFLSSQGSSFANWREKFVNDSRVNLETEIKTDIVVDTIARVFKMDCTDEDLKTRFKKLSEETGKSPLKLRAQYEAQKKLDRLEKEIVRGKVFDLLIEKNDVKFNLLSREEWEKQNPIEKTGDFSDEDDLELNETGHLHDPGGHVHGTECNHNHHDHS